jgi:alkylhydroperoxidase family enzyme
MAKLLQEIEWESPLFGADTGTGFMTELSRLSPWIGTTIASFSEPMEFSYATSRHMGIAYFVTSQENACRYCYGVARATMQIWGYSEKQIRDLEQQATLADGITRMVVEYARKLAKSNPTPARDDREALIAAGLNLDAVSEIAACVAEACIANRLATFLALPPNLALEKIPTSLMGRLRLPYFRRQLLPRKAAPPQTFHNEGPCAPIIAAAGRTHLAAWLRNVTDGWMSSPTIPRRSKGLMLAVIARQLGSLLCEEETKEGLAADGMPGEDIQTTLATLSSSAMNGVEERLLRWTRETVWYEPQIIQKSTQRLLQEVGPEVTLEAIGTAAICNTLARLSLVRQ